MSRFVTIGETMGVAVTDVGHSLRTASHLRLTVAGAESTVAIGLARLGHDVEWVGVVGDDAIGERIIRELAAEGVGHRHTRKDPTRPTGFMLRERSTPWLTSVLYYRRDSAGSALTADDAVVALTSEVEVLHLSGITSLLGESAAGAVLTAVTHARDLGITVSFDVNHRTTLPLSPQAPELMAALIDKIDIVFVGRDELHVLGVDGRVEDVAAQLLTMGPSEVVIKQGSASSFAALASGETETCPTPSIQIVDVIGAGDAFTAGYLAARAEGRALGQRLRWGTSCAARVIGSDGDWEGLPMRAEVELSGPTQRTIR